MSWTVLPVSPTQVRAYLDVNSTSTQYSDSLIGSNIRAAASFIQRSTNRQFEAQTATKLFTTEGRAFISIPDLRTVSSLTLQSSALTANSSYWLIEDAQHSGVYTGIQFRAFGNRGTSYLSNPEWFDRNLDRDWSRGHYSTLPNDLSITADWGWSPLPDEFLDAVMIYAAFKTRRPASVLADVQITPEGSEMRYGQLPKEVREFIASWTAGDQLVSIE